MSDRGPRSKRRPVKPAWPSRATPKLKAQATPIKVQSCPGVAASAPDSPTGGRPKSRCWRRFAAIWAEGALAAATANCRL